MGLLQQSDVASILRSSVLNCSYVAGAAALALGGGWLFAENTHVLGVLRGINAAENYAVLLGDLQVARDLQLYHYEVSHTLWVQSRCRKRSFFFFSSAFLR